MRQHSRALRPGLALAAVMAVVGCGTAAPDDAAARGVVTKFVEQLRTGEIDTAWESTTSDFKSDEGRESFRKYIQGKPVLAGPLEIAELKQVEIHGLTRWEAVLHPPPNAKSPATVRAMIAEEGDVWKVERLVVE